MKCNYVYTNGNCCNKYSMQGKSRCNLHTEQHIKYVRDYMREYNFKKRKENEPKIKKEKKKTKEPKIKEVKKEEVKIEKKIKNRNITIKGFQVIIYT